MGKDTNGKFFKKESEKEETERTEGSIIDQGPTKPSLNKTPLLLCLSYLLITNEKTSVNEEI